MAHLLEAYLSCRKNKRVTSSALKFELEMESKLYKLHRQLQQRRYKPKSSIYFAVTYPKPREIFAGNFQDRIVHHLLVKKLEPIFEKRFIYHSFACRKKKGTHSAISYLKKAVRQITRDYTRPACYGQFDLKNFFCSIDKNILLEIMSQQVNKIMPEKTRGEVQYLIKKIIFHDPTKNYHAKGDEKLFREIPQHKSLFHAPKSKGLPIGNLTSQFFANCYLNELDQFVKRELKIKHYLRYVDDFIVLATDQDQIAKWHSQIEKFLKNKLEMEMHPDKQKYGSVYAGIDFVGQFVKPEYTLIRRRVVKNFKTKLYLFNKGIILISNNQKQQILPLLQPPSGKQLKAILATLNSYYGLFLHADTHNLRKNLYQSHFGILKNYFTPVGDYKHFAIIKNVTT